MATQLPNDLAPRFEQVKISIIPEDTSTKQQTVPLETSKTEVVAKKFIPKETFAQSLTPIFLTGSIDLENPSSLKQLMMISKHDRESFLNNLKTQIPMVREAVRTNPGLLRAPGLPELFLNDYNTISQALEKDPTIVLLVGDTLKSNSELYPCLIRTAVASLILGNNHPKKILEKGEQVLKLAKELFHEPGIDNTTLEKTIYDCFEIIMQYQGVFRETVTKEQYEKAQAELQKNLTQISYKTFVTALTDAKEKKIHLNKLSHLDACNINTVCLALTPISCKLFLDSPSNSLGLLFNSQDRDILHSVIKNKPEYIVFCHSSLKNDPEFKPMLYNRLKEIAVGSTKSGKVITTHIIGRPEIIQFPDFPKELLTDINFAKQVIAINPALRPYVQDILPQTPGQWLIDVIPLRIIEILKECRFGIDNNVCILFRNNAPPITLNQLKKEVIESYQIEESDPLFKQLYDVKLPVHAALIYSLQDALSSILSDTMLESMIIQQELTTALGPVQYAQLTPKPHYIDDPKLAEIMGREQYKKCVEELPKTCFLLKLKLSKAILTLIEQNFVIEGRVAVQLFTDYLMELLTKKHFEKILSTYQSKDKHEQDKAVQELAQYSSYEFVEAYLNAQKKIT